MKRWILKIKVQRTETELILSEGEKEQQRRVFNYENDLAEQLLPRIDEILRGQQVDPSDLADVVLESSVPEASTSHRVALATVTLLKTKM